MFELIKYKRETYYPGEFFQMLNYHNADSDVSAGEAKTYDTSYSGYIGIQPYTQDEETKE